MLAFRDRGTHHQIQSERRLRLMSSFVVHPLYKQSVTLWIYTVHNGKLLAQQYDNHLFPMWGKPTPPLTTNVNDTPCLFVTVSELSDRNEVTINIVLFVAGYA
ncbi:hypothetical protein J6590_103716 [Homalodisca vitripennis]|nr:hypothetical protein J6590_103716 [Homalodisca vitripennis]